MEQGALPDKKDRQSRHPFQRLYDAAGCQVVAVGAGPWRKERPTAVPVLLGGGRTMCALAGALSSQRLTRKE